MRTRTLFIVAAAAAAGCSSLTPTEDPVYLRLTDIEARLMRIERVFENESLIQLASQIDQLRADTAALRGEVETLRYETEGQAERQRDLYVDVDQRLQALEQAQSRSAAPPPSGAVNRGSFETPAPSAPPVVAAPPPQPTGTDQENYNRAFELIQARRYQEASQAFQSFLMSFPTSPLADNAQYWLAETYYVQRQFAQALPEFQKVIDNFPQSAKLPDALLKVGYCQDELNDDEAARAALQRVMREFPDTTAARLATQRLENLSR